MRTVVFADSGVASKLNSQFIALQLNLSETGFPPELPGLEPWRKAYEKDWKHQVAFATSIVLFPNGKGVLGTSGCGHRWELDTSINYDPAKYLSFLAGCATRQKQADQLLAAKDWDGLRRLKDEITAQCREANRCSKKPSE